MIPPALNFSDFDSLTIRRTKRGSSWAYYDSRRNRVSDQNEIARLNAIALPPAYTDARFNPDPHGHLQAVGLDQKGRKQYRYHVDYRASQEAQKFASCLHFGEALPKLRKHLSQQIEAKPTSRDAVIAAVIRILDTAYLRIGNEAYYRANKSFGLTTLRNRHAKLRGQTLDLQYRGKGGIMRSVRLTDRSLTRIVRRCQDLPGQKLFQYRDDDGDVRPITSGDVNSTLREITGMDFTAKNFRTWHASVIAFETLWSGYGIKETLDEVAQALGNTPAISRKSYVHPLLLETASEKLSAVSLPRSTRWHTRGERGFIQWLQENADETRVKS